MGDRLSGKMLQRLKWPSEKRVLFLMMCGLVTAVVAVGPLGKLADFLSRHNVLKFFTQVYIGVFLSILFGLSVYYLLVAIVGLFLFGQYDKLWLPAFVGLLLYLVATLIDSIFKPHYFDPGKLDGIVVLLWALLLLLLWAVPRQIVERVRQLVEADPEAEIARPGYKHSGFLKAVWVIIWGVVALAVFIIFLLLPYFYDWSNAYQEFYNYRSEWISIILWGILAALGLIDVSRTDARYFYSGVGLFTLWQAAKLWAFYGSSELFGRSDVTWSLLFLLIGGSLLLRAALNRPPPKSAEQA